MTQADFSRLGRNSIEVGYLMERVFPLYNVRFISLNDSFDNDKLHGDTGGVNTAFKYLTAEFYSRDLSMKQKSARLVKFRRGEYQSKICPYGYQKGPDGRMKPDEKTAPVVRLIFELAQNGKKIREIIEELFSRKIPTPGEYKAANGQAYHDISRCRGIWERSTLLRILNDERYTGTYIMGKREIKEVGSNRKRLKDESEWIKIPDHHPAIVSQEEYETAQIHLRKRQCSKKTIVAYTLRGKVYCGCCGHAMVRMPAKHPAFRCQYTRVDEHAACHGLSIRETELEGLVYETITRQAQIILSMDRPLDAGWLDIQFAEQAEYERQIERCMKQKRVLYERLISRKIGIEDYKKQKAGIDVDLDRWKNLRAALAKQTAQARMDEKTQSARIELAQEVVGTDGLTLELAEKLIDRVLVHPGGRIEISWEMKDFCIE